MGVVLRKRKNADGTQSLRLDIFHNGRRWIETLKTLKLDKANNVRDRELNKEKYQQAEAIAVARAAELAAGDYNVITDKGRKTIIAVWMQSYIDSYQKKDKRNMQGALNRFKDFLLIKKKQGLTFGALDALLLEDFQEYLESKSKGEGASSYYNRFKKMLKQAYRRRMVKEDVLQLVERKIKGKAKEKDYLTLPEIQALVQTSIESSEVKKAAIFSLMTGLRWVDVKALDWKHINLNEHKASIVQSKTGESVLIELNEAAVKILGEQGEGLAFNLPTANGANKTLQAWVKRAGIAKKITWHNLRHSAGTNLAIEGVDVLTISRMLGHVTTKHTLRYVRTAEDLKRNAAAKLNIEI